MINDLPYAPQNTHFVDKSTSALEHIDIIGGIQIVNFDLASVSYAFVFNIIID